jgi:hypothetical protein
MSFWNKRKVIDRDPKTLDLTDLIAVEKSLVAKLWLVNNEIINRYSKLIESARGAAQTEEAIKVFADGIARRINVNLALERELSRTIDPKAPDRGAKK